jgi:hypothetical protein
VPDDVADQQRDPVVRQRHGVEPVPACGELVARDPVLRGAGQLRQHRHPRWEQTALQLQHDVRGVPVTLLRGSGGLLRGGLAQHLRGALHDVYHQAAHGGVGIDGGQEGVGEEAFLQPAVAVAVDEYPAMLRGDGAGSGVGILHHLEDLLALELGQHLPDGPPDDAGTITRRGACAGVRRDHHQVRTLESPQDGGHRLEAREDGTRRSRRVRR